MKIAIINGPNLNLVGIREPGLYGRQDFPTFLSELRKKHSSVDLQFFQSNVEGEIIGKLHEWGFSFDGIILNAGAYSHTSVAIADAVSAVKTPVVEVHLTNIFAREDFRHVSFTGARCLGSISGFGLNGYEMALNYLLSRGGD